jgi:carboxyl-terminal processing protease
MRLPRFFRAALWLAAVPVAFAITDRDYATNPLMQNEVRTLKQMLDYVHFNRNALRSEDYPKLITDYVALLDPQRLYFTASDEQSLRRLYGPTLENNIAFSGNIDAAFRIYGLFEQRVRSRVTWVHEQLAKDIDLTADDTYMIDRSKAPWPADQAEADALWMRRLKAELINEILNKKTPEAAKATMAKRFDRFLKNTSEVHPDEIEARFLTAFTRLYDPHSSYFSATDLEDFNVDINLHLVGIGAVLTVDEEGYCKIVSVVPGGPADLTGKVKANDKIVAVQQDGQEAVDVIGMRNKQIVQMIRGTKGTKVTLSIIPQKAVDQSKTELVTITRDVIKINQARASAEIFEVPDATGKISPIGVISLNSFYGEPGDTDDATRASASNDVAELIGKLKKENITALVLDLRRNGGGLLSEAVSLTGLFIPAGPVVQIKNYAGEVKIDEDRDPAVAYAGPLVVLTDRFSASASEIVAGALQNYGRAVVIGDSSTHGKGTVQTIIEMDRVIPPNRRLGAVTGASKLTIQKFYLPNGASTQLKGVVPDLVIPSIDEFLPIGEQDLPRALPWDDISTSFFDATPIPPADLVSLRSRSAERMATLPEFALLRRSIDRFKERQAEKTVSLNLETRRAGKAADKAFSQETKAARKALEESSAFAFREVFVAPPPPPRIKAAPKPEDDDTTDLDGEDEEDSSTRYQKLDVYLRESLRVLQDIRGVSPAVAVAAASASK